MTAYINPSLKLFQHLDRIQAVKQGQRPAPINAEIFLSNRCSHGCSWCHYAYTHTRGPLAGKVARPPGAMPSGDLMDYDLAVSMLHQLHAAGVKSVTFSGGGEPTLHPRFDDIVGMAADTGLSFGVYTHGGHLSEERAKLLKRRATWIYVSLDECTAEAFQTSKGVNRFDAVLGGIRRLVAAEGTATVGVGFLLHEGNASQVHEMVRLARSLGVDQVQFRPTIDDYDQDAPGVLKGSDLTWTRRATGMLNAYQHDSFVNANVERFHQYANWRGHGYSTCFWSAFQVSISPSGQMWRCTNKTEHPSALLGNLSDEPFATIWARSGGPCQVDRECRLMCIGHQKNPTLTAIMQPMAHKDFI